MSHIVYFNHFIFNNKSLHIYKTLESERRTLVVLKPNYNRLSYSGLRIDSSSFFTYILIHKPAHLEYFLQYFASAAKRNYRPKLEIKKGGDIILKAGKIVVHA